MGQRACFASHDETIGKGNVGTANEERTHAGQVKDADFLINDLLCEWAYSWPEAGEMPLTADEVLETLVEYERNRSTPGVPSMFCIFA